VSRVKDQRWYYDILAAQIKHYKPDVLMIHDMVGISPQFLKTMKPYTRLLVGQHAATRLSDTESYLGYDLLISSFQPTVDFFRRRGLLAELHRLAFEPGVLSHLKTMDKTVDVTFIGSLFSVHTSRISLLEVLSVRFPQMKIWGPQIDHLLSDSSLRRCYIGQAWGREMYQILQNSKVTINHHGDIAPYANNMRLFEATGVGTLLVTDWKANLSEMFEPGGEVVAYRTAEECAEMVRYYLEHEQERREIAHAGQQRTLKEHTYEQRMNELVGVVKCHIR
jgi:spore maturation protein CgeB